MFWKNKKTPKSEDADQNKPSVNSEGSVLKQDTSEKAQYSKYEQDVEYAYRKAIEYAKSFNKNLNFTKESIDDVEEILEYYANDLLQQRDTDEPVTENQIWSMSLWWGVYIGETLRRNHLKSYKWVNDDSVQGFLPVLKNDDDWILYPVSKVYKRLTNGKEDSVISFYDVALEIMTS